MDNFTLAPVLLWGRRGSRVYNGKRMRDRRPQFDGDSRGDRPNHVGMPVSDLLSGNMFLLLLSLLLLVASCRCLLLPTAAFATGVPAVVLVVVGTHAQSQFGAGGDSGLNQGQ